MREALSTKGPARDDGPVDLGADPDRGGLPALEQMARPLLELLQLITGMETTFLTHIDWDAHAQEVLHALNTGELVVPEGSTVDWSDSMCRQTLLDGREVLNDISPDLPNGLGMQTFMAVPILVETRTIGTVCGASRRRVDVDDRALRMTRLVAESLATHLAIAQESLVHRARADDAEVLALTDALTGLANRRAFTARWAEELLRSTHHDYAVSVLMVDVDRFKAVNDRHGHDVGDSVLRAVGEALSSASRGQDVVARLGGDEFAVIAAHTVADGATLLADRARGMFAGHAEALGVDSTLSIGVSSSDATPRGDLLVAADVALYEAKDAGRDSVVVWRGGPPSRDDADILPGR